MEPGGAAGSPGRGRRASLRQRERGGPVPRGRRRRRPGGPGGAEGERGGGPGSGGPTGPGIRLHTAVRWRLVATRGHLLPTWGHWTGQQGWDGVQGDPTSHGTDGAPFAPGHHQEVRAPGPVVVLRRPGVPGAGGGRAADGGGLRPGESMCRALPGDRGVRWPPLLTPFLRPGRGALATTGRSPSLGPPSRSSWAARSTWW